MYERMLNKKETPSPAKMTAYCGETAGLFSSLNEWLTATYATAQQITFPYGNQYGWGIAHRLKKKLICNVFAENNSFTVMVRLSGNQYQSLYAQLQKYTQEYIDNQYPCGDGGWIQYRVTCREHFDDIQKILSAKCS
ncbi:DUF3788 domain-containing protein [uncultured Clostridium sp.]|uniref:DUF3788 domain-containing protein n=1 Tax=uncultured Clostridium sp. TaxID=59620 RepID=UPI0025CFE006|nr:DUF3788 domain-containing protein [uncultured Clostridium sp.]